MLSADNGSLFSLASSSLPPCLAGLSKERAPAPCRVLHEREEKVGSSRFRLAMCERTTGWHSRADHAGTFRYEFQRLFRLGNPFSFPGMHAHHPWRQSLANAADFVICDLSQVSLRSMINQFLEESTSARSSTGSNRGVDKAVIKIEFYINGKERISETYLMKHKTQRQKKNCNRWQQKGEFVCFSYFLFVAWASRAWRLAWPETFLMWCEMLGLEEQEMFKVELLRVTRGEKVRGKIDLIRWVWLSHNIPSTQKLLLSRT